MILARLGSAVFSNLVTKESLKNSGLLTNASSLKASGLLADASSLNFPGLLAVGNSLNAFDRLTITAFAR